MINKKTSLSVLGIAIVVVVSVAYFVTASIQDEALITASTQDEPIVEVSRAVIIDQLHTEIPNLEYQNKTVTMLENSGYDVDLFITPEITVDFYRKLPTMNYDVIVIRTHSVAFGTVEDSASLLTGEIYDKESYLQEQLLGQVGKAVPFLPEYVEQVGWAALVNQTYFTIGSKMVSEVMEGEFDDSVIVLAGCDTMSSHHLAESFLNKGASSVVGWNGLVGSYDNDDATIALLEKILDDEKINDAVTLVQANFTSNTKYDPVLEIYSTGV